jgi:hypothetical protein
LQEANLKGRGRHSFGALKFGQLVVENGAHVSEPILEVADMLWCQSQPSDNLFSDVSGVVWQASGSARTGRSALARTVSTVLVDDPADLFDGTSHRRHPAARHSPQAALASLFAIARF